MSSSVDREKMKVISVNVARPRIVMWQGRQISTGIFKQPVDGRVVVRTLNLDGDRQADLSVHGGPTKAVYAYPSEHYEFWRSELPEMSLPSGMFGENLTVEGMFETSINIGDRFRVGTVELMVTEPRLPCYKLGAKFQRTDIIKRFLASMRTGFYFSVTKEGEVEASDEIELISRDENAVTVSDIVRIFVNDKSDFETMRRALEVEALPESWKEVFRKQVQGASE
jgi:MOSC domain-containing protein YiiM